MELLFLTLLAFLAGFIDAVVGGGGLIQIPALFSVLPQAAPATLFGTNKLAAVCGTAIAAVRYARLVRVRWSAALPAALSAFVFSFVGAAAVSHLPAAVIRPIVLLLLILVAVYTFMRKDFGRLHAPKHEGGREQAYGALLGMVLGFYDGFFGPGTGSFLIFLFVRFFGFDFLAASAASKVVNVATNVAALSFFAATDNILFHYAVPMALANMLGSVVGTRTAVRRGVGFVRVLFLIVLAVLIVRFVWDTWVMLGRPS